MDRKQLYDWIKAEIRIEDYARELGFTVVRRGRYYSLKEHDSVMIDPVKNCFYRNSVPGRGRAIGKGGSVIDFALEFTDQNLHEILKDFSNRVYRNAEELPKFHAAKALNRLLKDTEHPVSLRLPAKGKNMHRVYAYLIKTRKISRNIVQDLVDRKQLYEDEKGNCVFVGYDRKEPEKPVFASLRGTRSDFSFYGDVSGCDYDQCFHVDNKSPKLIITESVIDAMSLMTLQEADQMWKKYDYLALSGVGKLEAIRSFLKKTELEEIRIAFDQDEGGRKAAGILKQLIQTERPEVQVYLDLPLGEGNDWNDILKKEKIS